MGNNFTSFPSDPSAVVIGGFTVIIKTLIIGASGWFAALRCYHLIINFGDFLLWMIIDIRRREWTWNFLIRRFHKLCS